MLRNFTKEKFIEKAIKIHGYKYDYSKVNYINSYTKIEIICPIHGSFWQTPNHHLRKTGCPKCVYDSKTKTNEQFILEAKEKHNHKYDYSKTIYKGAHKKVNVICKIHGLFSIIAVKHLRGEGCPCCKYNCNETELNNHTKKSLNKNLFIKRAKELHGDMYNYDDVVYINGNTKVKIFCKKHEYFFQLPRKHLQGCGCPKCKMSKGERFVSAALKASNISFVYQKKFNDCIDKNPLPFDFYLPDYNLCIEYQGKQHYEPAQWSKNKSSAIEDFKRIKLHDNIKKEYCIEHKIKLLTIHYKYNTAKKIREFLIKNIKK